MSALVPNDQQQRARLHHCRAPRVCRHLHPRRALHQVLVVTELLDTLAISALVLLTAVPLGALLVDLVERSRR